MTYLDDAQRSLLTQIANGRQAQHLAAERGVDRSTIGAQMRRIRRRLGASNTAHAVATALRTGEISPDDIRIPHQDSDRSQP